jgi:hypothetical protein
MSGDPFENRDRDAPPEPPLPLAKGFRAKPIPRI